MASTTEKSEHGIKDAVGDVVVNSISYSPEPAITGQTVKVTITTKAAHGVQNAVVRCRLGGAPNQPDREYEYAQGFEREDVFTFVTPPAPEGTLRITAWTLEGTVENPGYEMHENYIAMNVGASLGGDQTQTELLTNPGFELATGWTFNAFSPAKATLEYVTSEKRTGLKSLRASFSDQSTDAQVNFSESGIDVSSSVGKTLTTSVFLKPVGFFHSAALTNPLDCRLRFKDASGNNLTNDPIIHNLSFGSGDWNSNSFTDIVPVGAKTLDFSVYAYGKNGFVYFDDASLKTSSGGGFGIIDCELSEGYLEYPGSQMEVYYPAQMVTAHVKITNKGDAHTFAVGFSLFEHNRTIDAPWTKVSLAAAGSLGDFAWVTLRYRLKSTAEGGQWSTRVRAWRDFSGGSIDYDYFGDVNEFFSGGTLSGGDNIDPYDDGFLLYVGEPPPYDPNIDPFVAPTLTDPSGVDTPPAKSWFISAFQNILSFVITPFVIFFAGSDRKSYEIMNAAQYGITGRDLTKKEDLTDWLTDFKDLTEFFYQGMNPIYVTLFHKNIRNEEQFEVTDEDWFAFFVWMAGGAVLGYKSTAKILTKNAGVGRSLSMVDDGQVKIFQQLALDTAKYNTKWYAAVQKGTKVVGSSWPTDSYVVGRSVMLELAKLDKPAFASFVSSKVLTLARNAGVKIVSNPFNLIFGILGVLECVYWFPTFIHMQLQSMVTQNFRSIYFRTETLLKEIEWGLMTAKSKDDYAILVPKFAQFELLIDSMNKILEDENLYAELEEVFPNAKSLIATFRASVSDAKERIRELAGLPPKTLDSINGVVTRVRDGDTIEVTFVKTDPFGENPPSDVTDAVRLKGLMAPEIDIGNDVSRLAGRVCKTSLQELLPVGSNVRISWDPEMPRDTYGRILGDVVKLAEGKEVFVSYEMRTRMPGNIKIFTKPTRAGIYLTGTPSVLKDGIRTFISTETLNNMLVGTSGTITDPIPPGEYDMKIAISGYDDFPYPEKVVVEGRALREFVGTTELTSIDKFGIVNVKSSPPGAEILLKSLPSTDFVNQALVTPQDLKLKPGDYVIKLKLDDYEIWSTSQTERYGPSGKFTVEEGKTIELPFAELVETPVIAELRITSKPPGARIFVFGNETDPPLVTTETLGFREEKIEDFEDDPNKPPLTGVVRFTLKLKDYDDFGPKTVDVTLGKLVSYEATLVKSIPDTGKVKITSTPSPAEIRKGLSGSEPVDTGYKTTETLTIDAEKDYDFIVHYPGYDDVKFSGIKVFKGQTIELDAQLLKIATKAKIKVESIPTRSKVEIMRSVE